MIDTGEAKYIKHDEPYLNLKEREDIREKLKEMQPYLIAILK